MLSADNGTLVFNPALYKTLSYNPVKDLAPVTLLGRFPMILVVGPGMNVNTVQEFVARAKSSRAASTTPRPVPAARTISPWNCSRWRQG